MTIYGMLVTFVMVWWLTLFTVLPWGAESQAEAGVKITGTEYGAPVQSLIKKKLLWTSIISFFIWAFLVYIFDNHYITLADFPELSLK